MTSKMFLDISRCGEGAESPLFENCSSASLLFKCKSTWGKWLFSMQGGQGRLQSLGKTTLGSENYKDVADAVARL